MKKNQKQPFTSIEKTAAEHFFQNSQKNNRAGISF